jgi:hypothetical protein
MLGCCSRLPFVDGAEPFDRDIQIAHRAKMGVQPLQLIPDLGSLRVGNHRREKQYRRAQAGQRDAHLMQRRPVAFACRFLIGGQIRKTAAGDHPKRGSARHHGIQPRRRLPALPRQGAGDGFAR